MSAGNKSRNILVGFGTFRPFFLWTSKSTYPSLHLKEEHCFSNYSIEYVWLLNRCAGHQRIHHTLPHHLWSICCIYRFKIEILSIKNTVSPRHGGVGEILWPVDPGDAQRLTTGECPLHQHRPWSRLCSSDPHKNCKRDEESHPWSGGGFMIAQFHWHDAAMVHHARLLLFYCWLCSCLLPLMQDSGRNRAIVSETPEFESEIFLRNLHFCSSRLGKSTPSSKIDLQFDNSLLR